MSAELIESCASALLYFTAGGLVLVFVYGRGVLHIKDGLFKVIIVRAVVALLTVPFALFGYWRGIDAWIAVPLMVLLGAVVVEVQRLVCRARYKAEPPVEEECAEFSLFRFFTTTSLAVRRYDMKVPQWRAGRLRIAHISDLHVHKSTEKEYLNRVTERIAASKPDAVFITGDFISRLKYVDRIADSLEGLDAPKGVFASLGNHDYWTDARLVESELKKAGVQILTNRQVTLDAGGGDTLMVSGCDDPWGLEPWRVPERDQGVPLAVLSHTADNIFRLSRAGVLAVFSGHYHAGQAKLPWYGPVIIPSKYGRIFDHGHFKIDDTNLFVTAGVGAAFPPFRVYCDPEIIIVDLVPEISLCKMPFCAL